jgi:hypothetical protein
MKPVSDPVRVFSSLAVCVVQPASAASSTGTRSRPARGAADVI